MKSQKGKNMNPQNNSELVTKVGVLKSTSVSKGSALLKENKALPSALKEFNRAFHEYKKGLGIF